MGGAEARVPDGARIAVVVLHYVDSTATNRCLSSVHRAARPGDDVIVVDNSFDFAPADDLRSVHVVHPSVHNPGFSAGMNQGAAFVLEHTDAHLVLFVNNDVVVPTDLLSDLDDAAVAAPGYAAFGPIIVHLNDQQRVWSAGGRVSRLRLRAVETRNGERLAAVEGRGVRPVGFLSGCVIALRRELLEGKHQPWSERFFFGGEDVELAIRLDRTGQRVGLLTHSVVVHDADPLTGSGASHKDFRPGWLLNTYLNRAVLAEVLWGQRLAPVLRVLVAGYVAGIIPLRARFWPRGLSARSRARMGAILARQLLRKTQGWPEIKSLIDQVEDRCATLLPLAHSSAR